MPLRPIVRLNEHPCHRGIGITAVLSSTRGPRDTEAPSLGTGAAWARCPPEAGPKAVHQLPVWRAGRGMGCTSQMSPLLLVLWNAVCVCREGGAAIRSGTTGHTSLFSGYHRPSLVEPTVRSCHLSVTFLCLQCLWLGNPGQQKDNVLQFKSYIIAAPLNLGSVRK